MSNDDEKQRGRVLTDKIGHLIDESGVSGHVAQAALVGHLLALIKRGDVDALASLGMFNQMWIEAVQDPRSTIHRMRMGHDVGVHPGSGHVRNTH